VPAISVAAAAVEAAIDCVRSPLSPGLATRTEIATLHETHTVTPVTSSGGGSSAQSQCQLRTITVAFAGGAVTAGVASSVAQFQNQFQTKVCGGIDVDATVISFELSSVVLPVSPASATLPVAGVAGVVGAGAGISVGAGCGTGSGLGAGAGGTSAETDGAVPSAGVGGGAGGGTAGGIAGRTGDTTGFCGGAWGSAAASSGAVEVGGAVGA